MRNPQNADVTTSATNTMTKYRTGLGDFPLTTCCKKCTKPPSAAIPMTRIAVSNPDLLMEYNIWCVLCDDTTIYCISANENAQNQYIV